jgi:hypothetical protein
MMMTLIAWATLLTVFIYFAVTEPLFYDWIVLNMLRVQQLLAMFFFAHTKVKDPRTSFKAIWDEAQANGDKMAREYFPEDDSEDNNQQP